MAFIDAYKRADRQRAQFAELEEADADAEHLMTSRARLEANEMDLRTARERMNAAYELMKAGDS